MQKIGTVEECCRRFGVPISDIPTDVRALPVFRNGRLRSTLGRAVEKMSSRDGNGKRVVIEAWIEVHKCVFVDPAQMKKTLGHEIAHCIVGIQRGHNRAWQLMDRKLGGDGQRCTMKAAAAKIGIVRKRRGRKIRLRGGKEISSEEFFRLVDDVFGSAKA